MITTYIRTKTLGKTGERRKGQGTGVDREGYTTLTNGKATLKWTSCIPIPATNLVLYFTVLVNGLNDLCFRNALQSVQTCNFLNI